MPASHPAVTLDAKLKHLRQATSYPHRPPTVETKETHMSWVFLAGDLAYKLKKPIKNAYNFRSIDARRTDCRREVELNRRLADGVYHGVIPLTIDDSGQLQLEGQGQPVEWLVKMRRLPEHRMLDWLIEHDAVDESAFRRAIERLCRFYRNSAPFPISPSEYREHLHNDLAESCRELLTPRYGQSEERVRQVHQRLVDYLQHESLLLDKRVQTGRVIDAHGDLRPEHICLESTPVIIDCLQFDQRLRILDSASELSFLTLECDRLGANPLRSAIWSVYEAICDDKPADHLRRFYTAYHACLRAMVSVWHLKDQDVADPEKWIRRANDYLELANHAIGATSDFRGDSGIGGNSVAGEASEVEDA